MIQNRSYRPLSYSERAVLELLLDRDFPGRDELREQLTTALVRPIDADGCLEFKVDVNVKADVEERVPTEGEYPDHDGVLVHVLLHVVDRHLSELEVYKEDNSEIREKPSAEKLKVIP